MNTFAPALTEVNPAAEFCPTITDADIAEEAAYIAERDILDTEAASYADWIEAEALDMADDADDWSDDYVAHLEAEHAADAALDFATEHGYWPC